MDTLSTSFTPENKSAKVQLQWLYNLHKNAISHAPMPVLNCSSFTAMCEGYLKAKLARSSAQPRQTDGAATLVSMSVSKIIEDLGESNGLLEEVKVRAGFLNFTAIHHILKDPRTPFIALQTFFDLPAESTSDALRTARDMLDIDEVILANDCFLRAEGSLPHPKALLGLDDLRYIVRKAVIPARDTQGDLSRKYSITRQNPPRGGLNLLQNTEPEKFVLPTDDAAFISTFNKYTKNLLRGLDWTNVLVAGGFVLDTLLHLDPERMEEEQMNRDFAIDLYIYGLGPTEAFEKVQEINNAYKKNLVAPSSAWMVFKYKNSIILCSKNWVTPLRIHLDLLPSPLQVLLQIEEDQCAVGFNGKQVLMLPRCARALKTGYSIFKADFLWNKTKKGDILKRPRVLYHIRRGFGLRILPSYVTFLKKFLLFAYTEEPTFFTPDLYACRWPSGRSIYDISRGIEVRNSALFLDLKISICDALGIPLQNSGWKGYLTRRIRAHVCMLDFDSAMKQQIMRPLIIPHDLEKTIHEYVSAALDDSGAHRVLIPVHVPGQSTSRIPDLHDTTNHPGNLRYWVISNELMWTGIDPRIDEVFELLEALHRYNAGLKSGLRHTNERNRLDYFAKSFSRKFFAETYNDEFILNGGNW